MADNKNHQDEEQGQVPPMFPVNKKGKQSENTQLGKALAIVDRLLLCGDVGGPTESLVQLKNILLRETIQIWDDKQKMRELMDENRRLRPQVINLHTGCHSHADSTRRHDRLATCHQQASKRRKDKKSAKKKRIQQPAKTLTEATNRELDNSVLQDDNSEDTIILAKKARQAQGLNESEFSYGGEVDLHKHMTDCKKNPDHKQFIPLDKFSKHHLPHGYQEDDLLECIRALAALTVRVDVTSDCLPQKGSKKTELKTGTGWILVVKEHPIWHNEKDCPCNECKNSTPKKKFAEIVVYTAGHVVTDEKVAQNIKCRLFFDREGTPETCEGVESFTGAFRVVSDPNGDRCEITFITHDLVLADKLDKLVKKYRDLHAKVSIKMNEVTTAQEQHGDSGNKPALTIIVSHPHGCSKKVTIGYITRREELREGRDLTRYTYTTPTCTGSSGAPVYIIGKPAWSMCEHPHSGVREVHSNENWSGYGLF